MAPLKLRGEFGPGGGGDWKEGRGGGRGTSKARRSGLGVGWEICPVPGV